MYNRSISKLRNRNVLIGAETNNNVNVYAECLTDEKIKEISRIIKEVLNCKTDEDDVDKIKKKILEKINHRFSSTDFCYQLIQDIKDVQVLKKIQQYLDKSEKTTKKPKNTAKKRAIKKEKTVKPVEPKQQTNDNTSSDRAQTLEELEETLEMRNLFTKEEKEKYKNMTEEEKEKYLETFFSKS